MRMYEYAEGGDTVLISEREGHLIKEYGVGPGTRLRLVSIDRVSGYLEWSEAGRGEGLMHRFNPATLRALCNWRYRARKRSDGFRFYSRKDAGSLCPNCVTARKKEN
jgi:hypothetical protein